MLGRWRLRWQCQQTSRMANTPLALSFFAGLRAFRMYENRQCQWISTFGALFRSFLNRVFTLCKPSVSEIRSWWGFKSIKFLKWSNATWKQIRVVKVIWMRVPSLFFFLHFCRCNIILIMRIFTFHQILNADGERDMRKIADCRVNHEQMSIYERNSLCRMVKRRCYSC